MPSTGERARLSVERIGGIDATTVELPPGVSVLTGRNATNRTSLLQGLMAALGSTDVSLKGDADEGRVRLAVDDDTYTRTLTREGEAVTFDGDPYVSDPTAADLFAFLLESNAARQAVANGDDLRKLIMRPIDTEAIHEEIADLRSEHRELDRRIQNISTLETERSDLRDRRAELDDEIDALEADLRDRRATLERIDGSSERSGGSDARDDPLERIREVNAELDEVRFELEAERESLAALEDEAAEIRADLAEYPDAPAAELEDVERELDDARDRKRELEGAITDLQQTLRFNERLLDGDDPPSITGRESAGDTAGGDVVCWTCGSTVARRQIERTLEQLRTLRDERREERSEVADRIDSLRERRSELEEQQRRRSELEARLDSVEAERDERRERIADLERRRDALESEADDLDAAGESTDRSTLLAAHRAVNRIEFELEQRREEREAVASELDDVERELDRRDDLEARQDEIESRIDDLRRRIEELERTAVAEFNDHMARVLDILEYTRLSRIWIERRADGQAGRTDDLPTGQFVLHIERRTDDGTTYEDVIDHLSESEREVTGLVFAFAGYLVHEVYDDVPFLLLDSLEAVDAGRIKKLVDYVRPYADYLVVALLPEDARALPDAYHRVTDI